MMMVVMNLPKKFGRKPQKLHRENRLISFSSFSSWLMEIYSGVLFFPINNDFVSVLKNDLVFFFSLAAASFPKKKTGLVIKKGTRSTQ